MVHPSHGPLRGLAAFSSAQASDLCLVERMTAPQTGADVRCRSAVQGETRETRMRRAGKLGGVLER
eukprot:scaffold48_cov311-Pinguiococcus_pyrenoidosus.AAC.285